MPSGNKIQDSHCKNPIYLHWQYFSMYFPFIFLHIFSCKQCDVICFYSLCIRRDEKKERREYWIWCACVFVMFECCSRHGFYSIPFSGRNLIYTHTGIDNAFTGTYIQTYQHTHRPNERIIRLHTSTNMTLPNTFSTPAANNFVWIPICRCHCHCVRSMTYTNWNGLLFNAFIVFKMGAKIKRPDDLWIISVGYSLQYKNILNIFEKHFPHSSNACT